jgi:hypothetical protein
MTIPGPPWHPPLPLFWGSPFINEAECRGLQPPPALLSPPPSSPRCGGWAPVQGQEHGFANRNSWVSPGSAVSSSAVMAPRAPRGLFPSFWSQCTRGRSPHQTLSREVRWTLWHLVKGGRGACVSLPDLSVSSWSAGAPPASRGFIPVWRRKLRRRQAVS